MKTDDVMLKWMQRIWLWVLSPFLAAIVYFVSQMHGMDGGFLIIWASLIYVPAAWPLAGIPAAILTFWPRWWPTLEHIFWIIIFLIPTFGYVQWFILIPRLFANWDEEKIRRFWKYWAVSVLVGVLLFGGGVFLINMIPYGDR